MAIQTALIQQAGVVPLRNGQICLVSSRSGKRWVVPKGCMEPGMTAGEVGLQEAWEEAGLVGLLGPEPVGSYLYAKWGGTCHVTVFLMQVTEVAEDWPERSVRQRRWVSVAEALQMLDDEGLRAVVRGALLGGAAGADRAP